MSRPVIDQIARLRTSVRRRSADLAVDAQAALALRLVESHEQQGSGWFWETDRSGTITYLSATIAAQLKLGGPAVGEPLSRLFQTAGPGGAAERALGFHLQGRTAFRDLEVRSAVLPDGGWTISGRPIIDELGQFRGFTGSGTDLSEKQRVEAEFNRLALYDSLTGLANRENLRRNLDLALARHGSDRRRTALLMLDLDRFKAVNDTLGHQAGDALLRKVAARLRTAAEKIPGALIGRIGGDEFQIILADDMGREELAAWAGEVIATLCQPYTIKGASVSIGSSIGIAVAPDDGLDAETLVRNADLALYAAKGAGRGVLRFFEPDLLAQARSRKEMEDDLRGALAAGQLDIAFQPVVTVAGGQISGYEALLRWHHPTRGQVSPSLFVPVAEETGLVDEIGAWVLRTACARAAQWPAPVRVAVNVSPVQFARPAFPALVASALAASGLQPARLELEITESVFIGGGDRTDAVFTALKRIGVRLALDDFGTGYSSLGYLQTAPFDKIKIDQSFVRGAVQPGNRNAAIIKAIVTLADALGMETTAEGLEAQDEIALIRELGCSHIQGFVYGRPVFNDQVLAQLSHHGAIEPTGVRATRAPRVRMLRSVLLERGGRQAHARLRDLSMTGALVDQFGPLTLSVGNEVLLELTAGTMTRAVVVRLDGGRAGLQLLSEFDFT